MSGVPIRGVVPILPTPFHSDDEVDLQALAALVDFSVAAGVAAVGTPAFGSEFYKLTDSERLRVLESVIARASGRIPVIAQCNHHSPRHAARLAGQAEAMGATRSTTSSDRNGVPSRSASVPPSTNSVTR